MKRVLVVLFLLASLTLSWAAEESAPALSVGLFPALQLPFATASGGDNPYLPGGSAALRVQYDLAGQRGPALRAGLDYYVNPYLSGNSLSLIALSLEGGYLFGLGPLLTLAPFAGAGYNVGFKNADPAAWGHSLFLQAWLDLDLLLTPSLSIRLGAGYRFYAGLVHVAGVELGASWFATGREGRAARIESAKPIDVELLRGYKTAPPGKGLAIESATLGSVFPVFRTYYDDHPLGTVTIRNNEPDAIDDVAVVVFIKDLMDAPKTTPVGRIGAGTSVQAPLFALFNERILDITEATKAPMEVAVEYRLAGSPYRAAKVETLRLLDRNAMSWDDDRRAAAFVTAKDPAVMEYAKAVMSATRDAAPTGFNDKLVAAVALHEALALSGLTYVVDPKSSYTELSTGSATDYLQFPRQTLQYRAGDCDDLSILNAALLEAVGVDTAFLTVPGHIFLAFSLGLSADEARRTFASSGDLIMRDGRAWLPVEITSIASGFLRAWRQGADGWRKAEQQGGAGFHPVRDAWAVYGAVALPGAGTQVPAPDAVRMREAFSREIARIVDAELAPQIARIEEALRAGKNPQANRNLLGVLYARFGRLDQAVSEFQKALTPKDYAPALMNLGNVSFLRQQWKDARGYYERAARLDPGNPRALVAIARAAYELAESDPAIATQFAYLEGGGGEGTRAGVVDARETVLWEEVENR
ncbi:MAG: tetratricopeptide repeat protein [Spirochaetes bacterium]|nr:tetratricopeptide repeat protein [Spirochaetota bacterium]